MALFGTSLDNLLLDRAQYTTISQEAAGCRSDGCACDEPQACSYWKRPKTSADDPHSRSAATNIHTGEGVAVKKVTNVFSKRILAKRALREIKLLQHFRGKLHPCWPIGFLKWFS